MNHDGEAEGHQQWRKDVLAESPIQYQSLQAITKNCHDGYNQQQHDKQIQSEGGNGSDGHKGGQDGKVAVRDIDHPHDAEGQRQPGGKEGIEPSHHEPL